MEAKDGKENNEEYKDLVKQIVIDKSANLLGLVEQMGPRLTDSEM